MNITILANNDLAGCVALNYLVPQLENHVITVFLSSQVGKKQSDGVPAQLAELKFFEQTLFTELLFPALDGAAEVVGKAAGLVSFQGLRRWSVRGVEVLNRINEDEGLARLRESEPELVLSIRYGVILKDAVIGLPRLGVLNLHAGRLPDYRGVMGSFWAMLNGEAALGTTLHYIDDVGVDTGRIVNTTTLPVRQGKSYLWHVLALYEDGCRNMAEAVHALAANESLPASPQPSGGHYYTFPTEAELARFAENGRRLFDRDEVAAIARRFLP
ncbi:MAG: formyl transferase [Pseudohongiellaceae bacterium]